MNQLSEAEHLFNAVFMPHRTFGGWIFRAAVL